MFEDEMPKPMTEDVEAELERIRREFQEYEEKAPVDPEEGDFCGI